MLFSAGLACLAWISIGFVLKFPALRRTMWPVWLLHILSAGTAVGSVVASGSPLLSFDTVFALIALSSFVVFLIVYVLVLRIPYANGRPAVGDTLPDFDITLEDGSRASIQKLIGDGPAMLVFFRGFWCMSCTDELRGLTKVREVMQAKGGDIIAISADKLQVLLLGKRNQATLPCQVVCDPGAQSITALNLLQANMSKMGKKVSIPATVLVDREGIVQWTHYAGIVMDRPDPKSVLDIVTKLL